MCCCGKPVINGQPGYKWQPNDAPIVRQPFPPALDEGDELLYDEPGRCGGLDAHSHHFRVVRHFCSLYLMVQHGGGRERFRMPCALRLLTLDSLDSNARYWLLHTIFSAYRDGSTTGRDSEAALWRQAAAEKRIKTRKCRDRVKVWIETVPVKCPVASYAP